jgi:hypothetical protein
MTGKIEGKYDPQKKLESVKEEVFIETPKVQSDNDSIDSDIMKDLEAYRKE